MFQPPLKALVRPAPHATELRIVRENRFHSFCRNRQIKATFCYFCSTVLSCCSQHGCVKTTLSIYSIKSLYLKTKQSCFKPLLACLAFKLLVWMMLLVARFACSLSYKIGSQKVSFLIFFLLWSPLPHISPTARFPSLQRLTAADPARVARLSLLPTSYARTAPATLTLQPPQKSPHTSFGPCSSSESSASAGSLTTSHLGQE